MQTQPAFHKLAGAAGDKSANNSIPPFVRQRIEFVRDTEKKTAPV
jgi:hypothetical protein